MDRQAIELVLGDRVVRFLRDEKAMSRSPRIPAAERARIEREARALQDRWSRAAELTARRLLERQKRVVLEKLRGNKARKGTRFYDPGAGKEPIVTKALSAADAWDEARWNAEFAEEFVVLGASLYREIAAEVVDEFRAVYGQEAVDEALGIEEPPPEEPLPATDTAPTPPPPAVVPPEGVSPALVAMALLLIGGGGGQASLGAPLVAALASAVAARAVFAARANDTTRSMVDETIDGTVRRFDESGPRRSPVDELLDVLDAVGDAFDRNIAPRAQAIGQWFAVGGINEAGDVVAKTSMLPSRKYWLSMRDELVRAAHRRPTDGQIRDRDEPFDVDGWPMQYPGDPSAPIHLTINCRCLPGDQRIGDDDVSAIRAASRRWFQGTVVRLTTANGHQLAVTPNHPVLTPGGWVAAGELHEGDHVVSSTRRRTGGGVKADPDVDDRQPTIEEFFTTLSLVGWTQRVASRPPDFYGDGANGEVEIAAADYALSFRELSALNEQRIQLSLALSHGEMGLDGQSSPVLVGGEAQAIGLRGRANRDTCSNEASPDDDSLVCAAKGLGDRQFGFPVDIPPHDVLVVEASPGSSCSGRSLAPVALIPEQAAFSEDASQRGRTDTPYASGFVAGEAAEVGGDCLVEVALEPWQGYVYDLQTTTGSFMAEGIVVHNCVLLRLPPKGWRRPNRQRQDRRVPEPWPNTPGLGPVDEKPEGKSAHWENVPRDERGRWTTLRGVMSIPDDDVLRSLGVPDDRMDEARQVLTGGPFVDREATINGQRVRIRVHDDPTIPEPSQRTIQRGVDAATDTLTELLEAHPVKYLRDQTLDVQLGMTGGFDTGGVTLHGMNLVTLRWDFANYDLPATNDRNPRWHPPIAASTPRARYTVVHEYGHLVAGDYPVGIASEYMGDDPGALSEYAATDPAEWFAEAFAAWYLTPESERDQLPENVLALAEATWARDQARPQWTNDMTGGTTAFHNTPAENLDRILAEGLRAADGKVEGFKKPDHAGGYGASRNRPTVIIEYEPGAVTNERFGTIMSGDVGPDQIVRVLDDDYKVVYEREQRSHFTASDVSERLPFAGDTRVHRIEIPNVAELGLVVDDDEQSIRLSTLRTHEGFRRRGAATAIMDYLHDTFAPRFPGYSIIDSGHTDDGDEFWRGYTRWRPEPWRPPGEKHGDPSRPHYRLLHPGRGKSKVYEIPTTAEGLRSVVDGETPLYHATPAWRSVQRAGFRVDADASDMSGGGWIVGVYLTPDFNMARENFGGRGRRVLETRVKLDKPLIVDRRPGHEKGLDVYADAKKVATDRIRRWSEAFGEWQQVGSPQLALRDVLVERGYDGVVHVDDDGGRLGVGGGRRDMQSIEVVVFDPVKVALLNEQKHGDPRRAGYELLHPKRPRWKPSMTRLEADEWNQGSAIRDIGTHAVGFSTSPAGTADVMDAIRRNGFIPSRSGTWGPGIYVGHEDLVIHDEEVRNRSAVFYRAETPDRALAVAVNVRNPLRVWASHDKPRPAGFDYEAESARELADQIFDELGLEERDRPLRPYDSEWLQVALSAMGYDGILVDDGEGFDWGPGGGQVVVFDKHQATVVLDDEHIYKSLEGKHGDPSRPGYSLLHPRQRAVHESLAESQLSDRPIEFAARQWLYWESNKAIRHAATVLTDAQPGAADPGLHRLPPILDDDVFIYGAPPARSPAVEDEDRLWAEEGSYFYARQLLDHLAESPRQPMEFYRVVNLPLDAREEFDRQIASGSIDVPLMAVADQRRMVERFAGFDDDRPPRYRSEGEMEAAYAEEQDFEERYGPRERYPEFDDDLKPTNETILYVVEPGARAFTDHQFSAAAQSSRGDWQEWITGGRFDVVGDHFDRAEQVRVIRLRQAQTFRPKEEKAFWDHWRHVPRDEAGRWTDGGAAVATAVASTVEEVLDRLTAPSAWSYNDDLLAQIARARGFDAKPRVVSESQLRAAPGLELWRGVSSDGDFAEQFRDGEYFAGRGSFGNGTYTYTPTEAAPLNEVMESAARYAAKGGTDGQVLRMKLDRSAKTIYYDQLVDKVKDARRRYPDKAKLMGDDPGRWAAALGYDAIVVPRPGFHTHTEPGRIVVVLNRGKVLVSDRTRTARETAEEARLAA